MPTAAPLSGQKVLVYGLARSGLSALAFLKRSGATIHGWDTRAEARAEARSRHSDLVLTDPLESDISGFHAIVVSPGVPLNSHPLAGIARSADVPLVGDMELFQWARLNLPPHQLVAITGTNGKSTTTALLHHLLVHAGRSAQIGGNIGLPILSQTPLKDGGIYVLELSSFQIDLCQTFAADIVIQTNLSPDHLDRYDAGMAGYIASKARLFAMQPKGALAIIATDDEDSRKAADNLPPHLNLKTVSAKDVVAKDQARWPALAGPHNAQNVACARAAAIALGLTDAEIAAGLASFPGLAHRMEIVGTIAGVRYVNDSKATNPTSAAPALQAFPNIHWILGGKAKTAELDACLPHLAHVKAAYVIGEAAPMFREILAPHLPVTLSATLDNAVKTAAKAAQDGDTVLLSPACASYDQFSDFEARGDAFRALVEELAP